MRTGQMLTELRRSNAAGVHGQRPSRSQLRRYAVQEGLDSYDDMSETEREQFTKRYEEVDMSVDIEDYVPTGEQEPNDEEIWELEILLNGGTTLDELYADDFELYPTAYEDE